MMGRRWARLETYCDGVNDQLFGLEFVNSSGSLFFDLVDLSIKKTYWAGPNFGAETHDVESFMSEVSDALEDLRNISSNEEIMNQVLLALI